MQLTHRKTPDLSFRIRMRKGDIEVEVSGNEKEVSEAFDNIDKLADKFLAAFSVVKEPRPSSSARETTEPQLEMPSSAESQMPVIARAKSASEAVQHLLSSSWGERPRGISEITSALHANAMPYPATTLSGVLFHLVKKGKVRRFKTGGGYVYKGTSPEEVSNEMSQ